MSAFTVGQRVTVLSEFDRPLAITTVRLVSHRGTRVHLADRKRTFDKHGNGGGYPGGRITPTTPEHEEHFERVSLFETIMGAVYGYSDSVQDAKRAAISTATLRAVVALLGEVQP